MADLFGFHALQLGLPNSTRCAPTACRTVGLRTIRAPMIGLPARELPAPSRRPTRRVGAVALHCDFDALPFPSQSLDLVVLPHALELARDPHETLREVERVLVPEGRVVIVGFNPASLWGLRQRLGRCASAWAAQRALFLPRAGEFIGYWRLRDWLRLLSFEVEAGASAATARRSRSQRWLERLDWMERTGDRWWPVFGAVYFLVAVKRVRGMRLVGLVRDEARAEGGHRPAPVAATPRATPNSKPMAIPLNQ